MPLVKLDRHPMYITTTVGLIATGVGLIGWNDPQSRIGAMPVLQQYTLAAMLVAGGFICLLGSAISKKIVFGHADARVPYILGIFGSFNIVAALIAYIGWLADNHQLYAPMAGTSLFLITGFFLTGVRMWVHIRKVRKKSQEIIQEMEE